MSAEKNIYFQTMSAVQRYLSGALHTDQKKKKKECLVKMCKALTSLRGVKILLGAKCDRIFFAKLEERQRQIL